jgi:hypothetical protein
MSTINVHIKLDYFIYPHVLCIYVRFYNKKVENMTSENIEKIAQTAHAANKAWCEANGDFSQPSWDIAPDWQRKSAINGVEFHINNPDAGDSASHDNWMAEKIEDGWVYGDVKDPEQKTHPCIVPFEDLPKVQQVKDALFRSIVHAAK